MEAANDFNHQPTQYFDLSRPTSEIGVPDEFVFFDNPFTTFTSASVPILGEDSRGLLTLGRPATPGGDYGTFQIDEALLPASVNINPGNLDAVTGNPTVTYNANGDTNDSQLLQIGAFFQDDIQLAENWSWLFGGRVDYIHVETEDPLFDDIVAFLDRFGVAGEADRVRAIGRDRETLDEFIYNVNSSLVFKPTHNSSVYITGNYAEAPGLSLGGGVSVGLARNEESFVRESRLIEAGYKATFLDRTLFTNVAIYYQERSDPIQGGQSIQPETSGFEFEMNYQPNKQFYATFGYSFTDAEAKNLGGAFVSESAPFNGSFNNINLAVGDSESPGVPDHLFNFLTSYKLTETFGVTFGGVVTSPVNLTYANATGAFGGIIESAEIPWQYSLDTGLFYETPKWSLRLNVLNITDEENFGAVNPIYGNASLFVELPRRYELTASFKF